MMNGETKTCDMPSGQKRRCGEPAVKELRVEGRAPRFACEDHAHPMAGVLEINTGVPWMVVPIPSESDAVMTEVKEQGCCWTSRERGENCEAPAAFELWVLDVNGFPLPETDSYACDEHLVPMLPPGADYRVMRLSRTPNAEMAESVDPGPREDGAR